MPSYEEQIKRIQDKLQQLLKQHALLKKEKEALQEELDQQKKQATGYQEAMDGLKQQVDILKFSGGEMNEEEKKAFEKRLGAYIKEIDRCIALLSE